MRPRELPLRRTPIGTGGATVDARKGVRRVSCADEIERLLRHIEIDGPPLHSALLPRLAELFRIEVANLIRPTRDEGGWSLDFVHTFGLDADRRDVFVKFLSGGNWSWTPFFPPTAELRNAVVRPMKWARETGEWESNASYPMHQQMGWTDDMGTIVTEGPVLLAYLGLARCGGVFNSEDETLLARLQPHIQRRLFFEYRLRRMEQREAAFDAAFEAIPAAAYLLRGQTIEHANRIGAALLAADRGAAEELAAARACNDTPHFRCTPLEGRGVSGFRLAIQSATRSDVEKRLSVARVRWNLNKRQIEVLELLAWGESNKGIAAQLGCGESTVEFHVTTLLRRAGAENRAALVAKFWTAE